MPHKVKMLKTQHGVRAGEIRPIAFIEGEEYDIDDALLESFIDLGVVELAKSKVDAPANKMKIHAPENKSK